MSLHQDRIHTLLLDIRSVQQRSEMSLPVSFGVAKYNHFDEGDLHWSDTGYIVWFDTQKPRDGYHLFFSKIYKGLIRLVAIEQGRIYKVSDTYPLMTDCGEESPPTEKIFQDGTMSPADIYFMNLVAWDILHHLDRLEQPTIRQEPKPPEDEDEEVE